MAISLFVKGQDSLKKEKSLKIDFALRAESLPYGPLGAQTIGPNPVVIGIINAKWKHVVSISYWESIDMFGKTGGDYHGIFTTINPFGKKNKIFFVKNAHFFDLSFEKKYVSLTGFQIKVGQFSISPLVQTFAEKAPRQILITSFSHKSFSFTNWIIRDNKDISSVLGIGWKSPDWKISKDLKFSTNLVYNRRFVGDFGKKDIVSIGTHFYFKK